MRTEISKAGETISPTTGPTHPITLTCRIMGRRWVIAVLYSLINHPLRFNEIHKCLPAISTKSLGRVLLNLEQEGLVKRTVVSARPPRVSYSLNHDPLLRQIIESLWRWGSERLRQVAADPKPLPPAENQPKSRQQGKSRADWKRVKELPGG